MLPLLVLFGVVAALALAVATVTVPPGEVHVYWSSLLKRFCTLNAGWHLLPPLLWERFFPRALEALKPGVACPAAGTVVLIDPPRTEMRSRDGIPGFIDVMVTCRLYAWDPATIVAWQPIKVTAERLVMRWCAAVMADLPAEDMSNYSAVTVALNDAIEELATLLDPLPLVPLTVMIDANGIKLHAEYEKRQAAAIAMMIREEEAEQLRHIETARITSLREAGLSEGGIERLLIAERVKFYSGELLMSTR